MPTKITLVTPPDIYQNDLLSILFLDISEKEQDAVSAWLGKSDYGSGINIYFYQGEPNIPWFLHSLSCCQFKYINLNNMSSVSSYLAGYVLAKDSVYYSVSDSAVASLYSHINTNKVNDAVEFLERIIGGKN